MGDTLDPTPGLRVFYCRLKSRKPYNKEAQEVYAKCHRMMHVLRQHGSRSGKHPDRTHPSTSPHIGPRRRRQARRFESNTLDDSKQTANWGRPVQSIHEEVGSGGQCSM